MYGNILPHLLHQIEQFLFFFSSDARSFRGLFDEGMDMRMEDGLSLLHHAYFPILGESRIGDRLIRSDLSLSSKLGCGDSLMITGGLVAYEGEYILERSKSSGIHTETESSIIIDECIEEM